MDFWSSPAELSAREASAQFLYHRKSGPAKTGPAGPADPAPIYTPTPALRTRVQFSMYTLAAECVASGLVSLLLFHFFGSCRQHRCKICCIPKFSDAEPSCYSVICAMSHSKLCYRLYTMWHFQLQPSIRIWACLLATGISCILQKKRLIERRRVQCGFSVIPMGLTSAIQKEPKMDREFWEIPTFEFFKVACSSEFSRSTNLESKLIEFFVFVNF